MTTIRANIIAIDDSDGGETPILVTFRDDELAHAYEIACDQNGRAWLEPILKDWPRWKLVEESAGVTEPKPLFNVVRG